MNIPKMRPETLAAMWAMARSKAPALLRVEFDGTQQDRFAALVLAVEDGAIEAGVAVRLALETGRAEAEADARFAALEADRALLEAGQTMLLPKAEESEAAQ